MILACWKQAQLPTINYWQYRAISLDSYSNLPWRLCRLCHAPNCGFSLTENTPINIWLRMGMISEAKDLTSKFPPFLLGARISNRLFNHLLQTYQMTTGHTMSATTYARGPSLACIEHVEMHINFNVMGMLSRRFEFKLVCKLDSGVRCMQNRGCVLNHSLREGEGDWGSRCWVYTGAFAGPSSWTQLGRIPSKSTGEWVGLLGRVGGVYCDVLWKGTT